MGWQLRRCWGWLVAPAVAVAAAVAGVEVLAYTGWPHRDAIGDFVSGAARWTVGAAGSVGDAASGAIGSAWEATTGVIGSAWSVSTGAVASGWDMTRRGAGRAGNFGRTAARDTWSWGRDSAVAAWSFTVDAAVDAVDWADRAGRALWQGAGQMARAVTGVAVVAASWVGGRAADVWRFGANAVRAAWSWTVDAVMAPVRLVWSGIEAATDRVVQVVFGGPATLAVIFPGPGAPPRDPAEVAAASRLLGDDERPALAQRWPELVGALDGAPAAIRSEANVIVLDRTRDALDEEIGRLQRRLRSPLLVAGQSYWLGRELGNLQDRKRVFDLLAADLGQMPGVRPQRPTQLLVFRPDEGRIALTNGDIDRATHVDVFIPGTGASMASASGYLDDQKRVQDQAQRETGGQHVAGRRSAIQRAVRGTTS